MTDPYQNRYTKHQKRKKQSLTSNFGRPYKKHTKNDLKIISKIMQARRSQRIFTSEPIEEHELGMIANMMREVPSSCDRMGVNMFTYIERDDKDLLSGLLVGGTGWMHRGQVIILLFADMLAYKNPAERHNMPYLDAGVMIQQGYLIAEALNIGCCFVNPNIRETNKDFFNQRFNQVGHLFCGALVFGKYEKKAYK
ncbi:MAG: nitroreductase family protein [Bacteroidetes bacterium]|nr:nitroreductase family protein [Bacteroidota bacterium]